MKRRNGRGTGKSKKKIITIIVLLIIAASAAAYFGLKPEKSEQTDADIMNVDRVTRGNVDVSITGSAAVQPNERYEIISMVSGDIISSAYDVGDEVKEGDILYQFDTSDTKISLEKQKLSLEQSKMSYDNALEKAEDLVVTAPCSGVISGVTLKVGDDVSQGMAVGEIKNSKIMKVVLPFNEAQVENIWIGMEAKITSSTNMGEFIGVVVDEAEVATPQADGSKLYDITVEFQNPGAIVDGQSVGGVINEMICPGTGTVTYSETGTAKTSASGTVESISVSDGDFVQQGETIMVISSDEISDGIKNSSISYKNAQLSLQEQQDNLDDYKIKSPISGTVITKNAKAGDTVDRTNSSTVLMVVADVSKLKFELAIDELDVSKVKEGQDVEITCDALEGEIFYGKISNVSVEGTASNGVTTYSAEVIIDEPGNLRPSMNVDASVIVESATDVLRVPTSDIKTAMGRSFVFVKLEEGEEAPEDERKMPEGGNRQPPEGMEMPEGENRQLPEGMEMPEGGNRQLPEGMEMPEGGNRQLPEGMEMPEGKEDNGNEERSGMAGDRRGQLPQAPDGFKAVEIVIGVSGEDFTEVISGLKEGDEIYSQTVESSGNAMFGMPGMGGMPNMGDMGGNRGGMGGGMPSGPMR